MKVLNRINYKITIVIDFSLNEFNAFSYISMRIIFYIIFSINFLFEFILQVIYFKWIHTPLFSKFILAYLGPLYAAYLTQPNAQRYSLEQRKSKKQQNSTKKTEIDSPFPHTFPRSNKQTNKQNFMKKVDF